MSSVRCFAALDLPAEVRGALAELQGRLRARGADLRWTKPGAMHLTLKFLGELAQETFEAVCQALSEPLGVPGPLRLQPRGLGAFPSPRRARVVWVGLRGDTATLGRLALTLEARAERCGLPREARPFRPHLTLGRSRTPEGAPGVASALEAEENFTLPPFEAVEVVLYESRLGPGGPAYTPRQTMALT